MKKYAIIVAGGTGSRMNTHVPKQFLLLHDKPVIIHTLQRFKTFDPHIGIVVVIHPDYRLTLQNSLSTYGFDDVTVCEGGSTRFHSVKNGLMHISPLSDAIIGVHDAARPLVSKATLERCYTLAHEKGNAIPVLPLSESLRQLTPTSSHSVNRTNYCLVQTPQCFSLQKALPAYQQAYTESFTDDAAVLEAFGQTIFLTEGNIENIKITHPTDMIIAEALYQLDL